MIVPRSFDNPGEPPAVQIKRMLGCIAIAHVFLGTCEAFERLFAAIVLLLARLIRGRRSR